MKSIGTSIAVCLLVVSVCGFAAEEERTEGRVPEPREDQKLILAEGVADLPRRYKRSLGPKVKALPEGHKLCLIMQDLYDPSPNKLISYLAQVVPVNAEGKFDGVQQFLGPFGRGLQRSVEWKEGVRHGTEKIYSTTVNDEKFLRMQIPWKNGKVDGEKKTFYPSGKVRSVTTYEDGRAHGESRSYTDDGKLTRKATMKDGKRDGKMVDYWPESGKPKRVIKYDMGRVVGTVKEYYANGQIKRELPFKDNAMHGTERQWEADGTLVRIREWEDGKMMSEKNMGEEKDE